MSYTEETAADGSESIGNRLRKRRITDDVEASAEEKSVSPKRQKKSSPKSQRKSPLVERTSRRSPRHSDAVNPKIDGDYHQPSPVRSISPRDTVSPSPNAQADHVASANHDPASSAPDLVMMAMPLLRSALGSQIDVESVVQRILEHAQKVDDLKRLGKSYANGADTESLPTMGAQAALKADAIRVLNILAVQVLHLLASQPVADLTLITAGAESSATQNPYTAFKMLFDKTKKVYAIQDSLLILSELTSIHEGVSIGRKANLVTFVTSCYGSGEVSFHQLNEYFLETFTPDGGRVLASQARLFLELKTQAYLSAMTAKDQPKSTILDDLFPRDLDQRLLASRPGAKSLIATEKELVKRARNRRKTLEERHGDDAALDDLRNAYRWDAFQAELAEYIKKNYEVVAVYPSVPALMHDISLPSQNVQSSMSASAPNETTTTASPRIHHPPPPYHHSDAVAHHSHKMVSNGRGSFEANGHLGPDSHAAATTEPKTEPQDNVSNSTNTSAEASSTYAQLSHAATDKAPQASHQTSQQPQRSAATTINVETPFIQHHFPPPGQSGPPTMVPYFNPPQLQPNAPAPPSSLATTIAHHPGQSASSYELLQRARQALFSRSSTTGRRPTAATASAPGAPGSTGSGQRQHWTDEEERALLNGIDQVGGPHWSRILQLHGAGGTHSEALQNRSQVPLKDKARNVKLFILKAGTEMPYYLQFVTGELDRRAPGHVPASAGNEDGGGENGEAAGKRSQTPISRNRGAPRAAPAPMAPTAPMGVHPLANGLAQPPTQYHSPYSQPPSRSQPPASQAPAVSPSPASRPPVPHYSFAPTANGNSGHALANGGDEDALGGTASLASSAAEEAARAIAALMGQANTQKEWGPSRDERGVQGDQIDPALG